MSVIFRATLCLDAIIEGDKQDINYNPDGVEVTVELNDLDQVTPIVMKLANAAPSTMETIGVEREWINGLTRLLAEIVDTQDTMLQVSQRRRDELADLLQAHIQDKAIQDSEKSEEEEVLKEPLF